ncbi:hypothetical protein AB0941_31775 [Streptomyces sp. NPDC013433]
MGRWFACRRPTTSLGRPCQACDPWPAHDLVFIIPAHRLPEQNAKE